MTTKKKNLLRRMDVRVALIAAIAVVLSAICVFTITYRVAYNDMLATLAERVDAIHDMIDEELSYESFADINNRDDTDKMTYMRIKELFSSVKRATGVQYLYTAKRGQDGKLIYVIDGLSQSASDFRYPGDLIESEIVPDLERALAGERVMPVDIKHTAWGDIFIAYLPIHNQTREVVGAVGIEFFAEHQYQTYQTLRTSLPLALVLLAAVTGALVLLIFRKLSAVHDRELTATDPLTGIANRSAYTRDLCSLGEASGRGLGVVAITLEGLRGVNGEYGHKLGDDYIIAMANALCEAEAGRERIYRMGGGEFVALTTNAQESELVRFAQTLETTFRANSARLPFSCSYRVGWVVCTGTTNDEYESAYRDACAASHQVK